MPTRVRLTIKTFIISYCNLAIKKSTDGTTTGGKLGLPTEPIGSRSIGLNQLKPQKLPCIYLAMAQFNVLQSFHDINPAQQ